VKAAVLETSYRVVVTDVETPEVEAGQALVRVKACGVASTDLKVFEGANPWALTAVDARRTNVPNIILGHELSGVVEQVADGSPDDLVGSRVGVIPFHPCEKCDLCRQGKSHLCRSMTYLGHNTGWAKRKYYPGGMAELCPVWLDACQRLPESVSFEDATFLDSLATAVHAVNLTGLGKGSVVLVIGCGPVGLCVGQLAGNRGAEQVFVSDTYPLALEAASEVSRVRCIRADTEGVTQVVRSATGNRGVDFVFDSVGIPETQRQARAVLAPGGSIVSLAQTDHEFSLTLRNLGAERSLTTSMNYLPEDFRSAIEALADGTVKVNPYITQRMGLSMFPRVIERLRVRKRHNALKAVIFPEQD